MQRRRRLLVTLADPDFRRLEALAQLEERATDQQASFILRRALAAGDGAAGERGEDVRAAPVG
jgi:hypothetical protein